MAKKGRLDYRKRGRISLDVDDTIANIMSPLLMLHNSINSSDYEASDVTDWSWRGVNLTTEQFYELYNKVWMNFTERIDCIVDKKLLLRLAKHYEIDLVTSRGNVPKLEETVKPLKKWLARHGISKFRLVISSEYSPKDTLGYDIYIDDSPLLAERIANDKKKILLLIDSPYNKHIKEASNIKRVSDVNEALKSLSGVG